MVQFTISIPTPIVVAIENGDSNSLNVHTKDACVDAVVKAVKLHQNESEDEMMPDFESSDWDEDVLPPSRKRARRSPISPPFRYINPPHVHLPLRSPHTPAPANHAEHGHLTRHNDQSMQIFVMTITGKTVTCEVRPSTKIWELAETLNGKIGAPRDLPQRILYAGKLLQYDRELRWYDIPKEATLHLVLRLKGS